MPGFCPNCGSPLNDGVKFCASCGTPIPESSADEKASEIADQPVNFEQPLQQQTEGFTDPANQQVFTDTAPQQGFTEPASQQGTFGEQAAQTFDSAPANEFNYFDQNQSQPQSFGTQTAPENSAVPTPGLSGGGAVAGKKLNPVFIAVPLAVVVVIIIAIAVILHLTRFETIDAKELIDVDFAGPNGYGVCYAQLDVDPHFAESEYGVYMEDYSISKCGEESSKIKYSPYFSEKKSKLQDAYKKAGSRGDAADMRDALLDSNKKEGTFKITVKPSKEKGLKNGDKVTIKVKYDAEELEEEDIKLTNAEFEVEVKGLTEAETIDPFEGFEPTFSGTDGNGEIGDMPESKYGFISYNYDYSSVDSYRLSNGDTVTYIATAYIYDSYPLDEEDSSKGVWFNEDGKIYIWPYDGLEAKKDYTVSGLTELEEVDPVGEIVLEYDSASPFLNVTASLKEGSVLEDNVYINVEDSYAHKYKIGDNVKISVSVYNSLAEAGYKLKGTPDEDGYYVYEVPVSEDAPKYVTDLEAYDAEAGLTDDVKNTETAMKQDLQGTSYYKGVSLKKTVKKVTALEKVKSYVAVNQITDYDSLGWSNSVNYIDILYKADCKLSEGKQTIYIVATYISVVKGQDGKFTYDRVDVNAFEKKEDAVDAIQGRDGYTVSEVTKKAAPAEEAPAEKKPPVTSSTTDSAAPAASDSKSDSQAADSSAAADTSSASADSAAASADSAASTSAPAADSKAA